jgi:glycosyltransferase involved in cell wall biosynthesis
MTSLKSYLQRHFPGLFAFIKKLIGTAQNVKHTVVGAFIPQHEKNSTQIKVFYLTDYFPKAPPRRDQYANGGKVKLIYLAEAFPHATAANILYTVSSVELSNAAQIIAKAKQRKLKVVVNQNGVAYPAWHGAGWEDTNKNLDAILTQADYIVYQSHFCRIGAERFLSPPNVPAEVLYNPVDTNQFTPRAFSFNPKQLVLILGGNQHHRYRFELAAQTLKVLTRQYPAAKLIVTGRLWDKDAIAPAQQILRDLELTESVTFTGGYTQAQAPQIFNQAHILLHTQYNDASPSLVLEAMASGLPVVYVDSGGVPEMVADAGVGVPVQHSWEQVHLPTPEAMADAVFQIMAQYKDYSSIARERTTRLFSLETFTSRHREIFNKVLDV